jgi:hypothetical protein
MSPSSVFGYAYILSEAFGRFGLFYRHGEAHDAFCSRDYASVAVALLDIVFVLLDIYFIETGELAIVLHGSEIGGGQKGGGHRENII